MKAAALAAVPVAGVGTVAACSSGGSGKSSGSGGGSAGITVPLFSLRSRQSWGIGEFPDMASAATWLRAACQSVVQILPLNELAPGESSPYSALSAMAIDPRYISIRRVEDAPDFEALWPQAIAGLRRSRQQADWSPDRHRIIDGDEVAELVPALAPREPTSGYLFYDCQTDDARLVLTVLGEAERFGAVCCNWLEVVALEERDGRAAGVRVRDGASGEEFAVHATDVVNATGVWADRIRPEELHDEAEVPTIRPSRGTHVTLALDSLPVEAGAIVPAAGGRTIFVLPWLGRVLVGTTDNDYEGDVDHVRPAAEDVEYLLEAVNSYFETSLGLDDLTGAYAGVRPLISTGDPKKSVDISRKAELYETSSGMITITGGKLTTWRRMAKMAVDRLVERAARDAPCRTQEIPLGEPIEAAELPRVEGVPEESYAALAARYGYAARDVLAVAGERGELAQPIVPGRPDLLAEAVFAARREQARGVADVLLRRTRLGLLAAHELCEPGSDVPERVAGALAGELGWDRDRSAAEAERFRVTADAEGILPVASLR